MKTIGYIVQHIYAWVFLLVCFGCLAIVGYWLFIQPTIVLTNINSSAIVNSGISNVVIAGKSMTIDRVFCIENDRVEGYVTRTFTNHLVYQLPDVSTHNFAKGTGCREKQYIVEVPAVLPSDNYEYQVVIHYKINPLRTVTYNLTPIHVKIVNPVWDAAKELAEEKK